MLEIVKNPYHHFRMAVMVSVVILAILLGLLFAYGKTDSFLLINGANHPHLDVFFKYMTYLGDGLIYIPMVLYCVIYNRKFVLPALIAIGICTLLTQGMKNWVFPDELRPLGLEQQQVTIHKIDGVTIHRAHSFPSGHTSTAFTTALLLTAVLRRRIWAYLLPVLAFLVGYSRVYLAQHYVTDISAGLVIGIISAYLALLFYRGRKKEIVAEVQPGRS